MSGVVVAGVAAVALAVVLTPLAMVVATRAGVVDRPGPLKPQGSAVPYLGGAAVFAALVTGAALGRPTVVAPLGGATLLGVLDDRFGLSPSVRLAGQVAVGGGVAACVATRVGGVGGGVVVALVAVVLMNGVNFIDGLDALASGVVGVACIAFAVVLHGGGRDLAVAGAGALAGFLVYNRPPARIYLGDGGAYLLGALAATLLALAWAPGTRTSVSVAALVFVAVPVAEVAFAVVRRLRTRQSITTGDRRHPYDLAVGRGWGRGRAALGYVAVEAVVSGAALAASTARSLPAPVTVAGAVALALVVAAGAMGALSGGPRVPA